MPIQITIEGANALEVKQLVHDLAGTLSGMAPEQIPPQTIVSTINTPAAPAVPVPPQAPAYAQLAAAPAAPAAVTTAPAPVPAAVPTAAQPPVASPAAPQQPEPTPSPAAVPTAPQTYTIDQLAVAATALMDAGTDIRPLLTQFGVQALTQLPKEQYGNFATALRQMGAKI